MSEVGRVDNLYLGVFCKQAPLKMAWLKERAMELAGTEMHWRE